MSELWFLLLSGGVGGIAGGAVPYLARENAWREAHQPGRLYLFTIPPRARPVQAPGQPRENGLSCNTWN
jgi:hypothetical protein